MRSPLPSLLLKYSTSIPTSTRSARTYATVSNHNSNPTSTNTMSAILSALNSINPLASMMTPPETPKESRSREQSPTRSVAPCLHPQPSADQNLLRLQKHLAALPTMLLKHMHLSKTRREDPRLFFKAMAADLVNMAPIVYTPTVGEACQKYHEIYQGPEGLYLSIDDKDNLSQILADHAKTLDVLPQIAVVTDGSRILGLGDLGLGGMGISRGKLNLYTAGGGIDPERTLAVVLDMGTNNEALRSDPLYLGLARPRANLEQATEFMDAFMSSAAAAYPGILIQHEDFYSEAAFAFLDKYRQEYRMFNDDVQGTGSVILGGFIRAAKMASDASGRDPREHKVVFLGGGSAAVGVAKEMMNFFTQLGLTEQEAKERFWLIDTKGLITHTRPDVVSGKLAAHKSYFIRQDTTTEYPTLESVIDFVKPTALVGLSTTFGAFTEPAVRRMAELNASPIIFPLSNPTSKCELSFSDALEWTGGKVLFASGSPYDPIEFQGMRREPGQGNNFLVFPGIGFGAVLCKAKRVTDLMITASAMALSNCLTPDEKEKLLLYPRTDRIREVSADVARGVIRAAQVDGVDEEVRFRDMTDAELLAEIKKAQWEA